MQTRDIGLRIRQIRKKAHLTQAAVAREFGCTQSLISSIEHGDSPPSVSFLSWLCDRVGGTSLDWLITGEENTPEIDLQIKLAEGMVSETTEGYGSKPLTIDERTLLNFYRQIPDEKKPIAIERISSLLIASRVNLD